MNRLSLTAPLQALLDWMANQGAKRYVAGGSIEHALDACHHSIPSISRFIVCPWDRPGDSPTAVFQSYQQAIDSLKADHLDCFVSIKLPSLAFDRGRLEALLEAAAPSGIRVHLDALTAESVNPTITMLQAVRGRYSNIGYTIPGRWRRSLGDIPHLLDLAIPLRVVKGQLPDRRGGEVPLHEGYLAVIEGLRKGCPEIGVATHHPALAERSLTLLTEAGIRCEVEQLFRLRPIPTTIFPETPRRLYVPYGHGYPPYDIYAAIRRPRLALRLTTDVVRGITMRTVPPQPRSSL